MSKPIDCAYISSNLVNSLIATAPFKGQYCKCFACNAGGSALDVTMKLYDLPIREAAKKLNEDFQLGLNLDAPKRVFMPTVADLRRELNAWRDKRYHVLCEAERRAHDDLMEFTDKDTTWDDPHFLTALRARTVARTEIDQLQNTTIPDLIILHKTELKEYGL